MRQLTLRVPDELHELVAQAAEAQQQSVNTFAVNALLAQVRAKSYSEWREHIARSHRATGFTGMSAAGHELLRTLNGDET